MLVQRTGKESVPPHMTMIFGAIAAVASSSASFPLEIVRRRAMMGTLPAGMGMLRNSMQRACCNSDVHHVAMLGVLCNLPWYTSQLLCICQQMPQE